MAKCSLCRKSLFRCECNSGGSTSEKVKGKRTGNTVRSDGRVVCPCGCYVVNGTCTNFTCSTRR